MGQAATTVPVAHSIAIHEIDLAPEESPQPFTLLELIDAVGEVSETEQELLATVSYMLKSGRVRLIGNFRDAPAERLCG